MARFPVGAVALAAIVILCFFFLFLLPQGLTDITSRSVIDDGITFKSYYPSDKVEIVGSCYPVKLQVEYYVKCSLCNSKDVREYFWFRKAGNPEFRFLKGERKLMKPSQVYTAEMEVEVCAGNSYEWYFCLDDGELKCAGRRKHFRFAAFT